MAGSCVQALRLTMVQILINSKGLQMNPIQSLYYVSPACMISLLAPFCLVELNEIRTRTDWVFNPSVMVANALTAFILNLVRRVERRGGTMQPACSRGPQPGSFSPHAPSTRENARAMASPMMHPHIP